MGRQSDRAEGASRVRRNEARNWQLALAACRCGGLAWNIIAGALYMQGKGSEDLGGSHDDDGSGQEAKGGSNSKQSINRPDINGAGVGLGRANGAEKEASKDGKKDLCQ